MGADAPLPAKYNADGSGRDTYIRRDPVECFGKSLYKAEPIIPTRMGAAGSHVERPYGKKPGPLVGGPRGDEFAPVGGQHNDDAFKRPARFLPQKAESYPVEITRAWHPHTYTPSTPCNHPMQCLLAPCRFPPRSPRADPASRHLRRLHDHVAVRPERLHWIRRADARLWQQHCRLPGL